MTDIKKDGSGFFGWAIWLWNVFCKEWVWQTFCKKWFWQTFCTQWLWKGFCVNTLYKKFDKWKAWLYLSPALILLAIFTVWPLINTIKMAFTVYWDPKAAIWDAAMENVIDYGAWKGYNVALDVGGKTQFQFGFENFIEVINYGGFATIMKNTIILVQLMDVDSLQSMMTRFLQKRRPS